MAAEEVVKRTIVTTFRTGRFLGNIFINLLFLIVWFLGLWLLLRFGWPAALGQALVYWLVMALFILPPVLTRAEEVARQRSPGKAELPHFVVRAS